MMDGRREREMEGKQLSIKVLMLPWLAHGHISPFLELAKKLTKRNFHVFMCSTPVNLSSLKKRITKEYSHSIDLVELHLPSLPDLPPNYHTTNGLPANLMSTLKTAYEMSAPNFSDILKKLKPDLVIYDFNQPWAAEAAMAYRIPAVQFITLSAGMMATGLHTIMKPGEDFPFREIYLREYEKQLFREALEASVNGVSDQDRFLQAIQLSVIVLIKSCQGIEGKYIDYASKLSNKKIVPVGPVIQDGNNEEEDVDITKWLDKKKKSSVVFVSFGSEYFLSKEETEEVAKALELSQVDFIWVIRFPVGKEVSLSEALPEGFLGRIGDRGLVVERWAPQIKILNHPSTGGFISHCGWSSIMESINFGVPIIAMPMHIDQPLNARVVEEIGAGVEAARDDNGRLNSEVIARTIKQVMKEESGSQLRRKVSQLAESLKVEGEEDMNEAIDELVKICLKKNMEQ